MDTAFDLLVVCDGGKSSGITYGSYKIYESNATILTHKQIVFGDFTSNQAEYMAFISAIKRAKGYSTGIVVVFTDSNLMKYQIEDTWACNYDHLRTLRDIARKEIKNFQAVKIIHVKRNIIKQHLGH